jgi:hypothetical protein
MMLDSARKTPVPVLARWLYRGDDAKTWEMCPRGTAQKPILPDVRVSPGRLQRCAVTAAERVIRWSTAGAVVGVAAVAAVASYEHAYARVGAHGEGGWTGRLMPLKVDGKQVASDSNYVRSHDVSAGQGIIMMCPRTKAYQSHMLTKSL